MDTTALLVNTLSIESSYGFRRINLYHGDLCAFLDDVLVVSSHAHPSFPPDGSVIRALRSRRGIDFTQLSPLISVREALGTYRVNSDIPSDHKALLVVRIPGADHLGWDSAPLEVYRDAVWSIFGSVAALELRGQRFQSMAMPLVGGRRKYSIPDAMAIILEQATRWLETSKSMESRTPGSLKSSWRRSTGGLRPRRSLAVKPCSWIARTSFDIG